MLLCYRCEFEEIMTCVGAGCVRAELLSLPASMCGSGVFDPEGLKIGVFY